MHHKGIGLSFPRIALGATKCYFTYFKPPSFIKMYSRFPVTSQYFTFDTSPANAKHKCSLYVYANTVGIY